MEHKTQLPGYYTLEEAARALGYASTSTLRSRCIAGTLPAYKIGAVWVVPATAIEHEAAKEIKPQGNRGFSRK